MVPSRNIYSGEQACVLPTPKGALLLALLWVGVGAELCAILLPAFILWRIVAILQLQELKNILVGYSPEPGGH